MPAHPEAAVSTALIFLPHDIPSLASLKSSSLESQAHVQALIPDDSASDPDPTNRAHQSENVEKPDDYGNHNNDIPDHPDLMIHWYVVIDEPQQHSNNRECNDE